MNGKLPSYMHASPLFRPNTHSTPAPARHPRRVKTTVERGSLHGIRNQAIVDCIADLYQQKGFPPTIREIAEALNISCGGGLVRRIDQLVTSGFLVHQTGTARGLRPFDADIDCWQLQIHVGEQTLLMPEDAVSYADAFTLLNEYIGLMTRLGNLIRQDVYPLERASRFTAWWPAPYMPQGGELVAEFGLIQAEQVEA